MDNIQDTLNMLNSGNISAEEIKRCLNSGNILVKSNAILAAVRFTISDSEIINQLSKIADNIDNESRVLGVWNSGHFAAAALKLLNTRAAQGKYQEVISGFSESQKEDIDRLISAWPI